MEEKQTSPVSEFFLHFANADHGTNYWATERGFNLFPQNLRIPVSVGSSSRNFVKASYPPADAPMPATGNGLA